jgi:hypothetical protein
VSRAETDRTAGGRRAELFRRLGDEHAFDLAAFFADPAFAAFEQVCRASLLVSIVTALVAFAALVALAR